MKPIVPHVLLRFASAGLAALLCAGPVVAADQPAPAPVAETPGTGNAPAPAATTPGASDDAAAIAATIARARAFIGTEERLRSVQSIRYLATWTNDAGLSHELDVVVRKPLQQRVIETLSDGRDIKVLDEYEGWRLRERAGNTDGSVLTLLSATDVRHMRAETWQNLYFYGGIERVTGRIEYAGEVEVEGVWCDKLVFVHPREIRNVRYFDKATGRLVLAELGGGAQVVLSGEMMVDGIRFARQQVVSGNGRSVTIVFNEIKLDEEFPDSLFKVPTVRPRMRGAPPPAAPAAESTPTPPSGKVTPGPAPAPAPDNAPAPSAP